MTRSSNPLQAYKCLTETDCPGGPPETCARGLTDIACGRCPVHQRMENDKCEDCEQTFLWAMILFYIAGVVCLVCTYYIMHSSNSKIFTLFCTTCAISMLVNAMQVHAVFSNLRLDFPDKFRDILNFFSFIVLDLTVLNIDCMTGSMAVKYVYSVAFFAFIAVMTPVCGLCSQLLPGKWKWTRAKTLNLLGQFLQIFFTTMAQTSLIPLTCYGHPDDTSRSMYAYPSVLCESSPDYRAMVGACIPLLVATATFYVLCVFLMWRAPALSRHKQHKAFFYQATKFLYFRFRLDAWWWGLVLLLRSLAVCMIPMAFPDDGHAQLILFVAVFVTCIGLHIYYWPWKLPVLNMVELVIMSCLLMNIVTAARDSVYNLTLLVMFFVVTYLAILVILTMACLFYFFKKFGIQSKDDVVFSLGKPPNTSVIGGDLQAIGQATTQRELPSLVNLIDKLSVYDQRSIAHGIYLLSEAGLEYHSEILRSESTSSLKRRLSQESL